MAALSEERMKGKSGILIAIAVFGIMGYVVYGSMARVERRCEVCVEFLGNNRCARGAGATDQEARDAAQTAICGVLASGMDETIRCQNTQPKSATCSS
jgi:hypothetical protein